MASINISSFFEGINKPPIFTLSPQNTVLAQRIRKLAEFARRNGPNFVELIRSKQRENPDYEFLFGGEGYEYYKWILFCYLNDLHPEENPKDNPDLENKVKEMQLRMFHSMAQESHTQEGNIIGNLAQEMTETHVKQNYIQSQSKNRDEQSIERHDQMEIENFQEIEQCPENNILSEGLQLPPEVSNGFTRVLLMLNGYKESIKASQHWFMSCLPMCEGMAMMMYRRVMQLNDFNKQLHIIYLINDILFKSLSQRQPGQIDIVARAFYSLIGPMLLKTYQSAGQTEEIKEKLMKILDFWGEKEVYDPNTLSKFQQIMLSGNNNLMQEMLLQASMMRNSSPQNVNRPGNGGGGSAHWQPQMSTNMQMMNPWPNNNNQFNMMQQQQMITQQSQNMATNYLPLVQMPYVCNQNALHNNQNQDIKQDRWTLPNESMHMIESDQTSNNDQRMAFDPPPHSKKSGEKLINPMSFPPGLIPKLVREKGKFTFSYSPLSPLDIEKAGLPSPPNCDDPYLKSRIEKFYSEIEEYRPGTIREYVELKKGIEQQNIEEDTSVKRQRKRRSGFDMMEDKMTGMLPDGSFAGSYASGFTSTSAYAGLGTNSLPKKNSDDDVYQNYRRLRSDVYHNTIPRGLSSISKDA